MTKRKAPTHYNKQALVDELLKLNFPLYDKKHNIEIDLIDNRARSNESRIDHIVNSRHQLKTKDIRLIPQGIIRYSAYRKDKKYKNTFNYYISRPGLKTGYLKVSIRLFDSDCHKAWIKTIYVTYKNR